MPQTPLDSDNSAPSQGARPVLVVDLDGTLLTSDMLYETLWSAMARDGYRATRALGGLAQGKAQLKSGLAQLSDVDVTTLPYDETVRTRIAEWRAEGGRTALVTASDHDLAQAVADHLGLFDDVQGSDGTRNLKGAAKADWLAAKYGADGFIYMGDSAADLAIWARAKGAISVAASSRTRAALRASQPDAEHIDRPGEAKALLRAIRPQQWLKNLLVAIPLFADPSQGMGALLPLLAAFFALSAAASAGYLANDLLDLRDDRSHPRKRLRPLASGALSARTGTIAIPALLLISGLLALAVSGALLAVVALYFVATTAYSVRLKQHTVIDICILAFLFTLRIIAGGVALGLSLSVWILAFSMFIFFALAAVKRLAELTDNEATNRETSRRGYVATDRPVISQMAITSGFLAVLVLALYVDEPTTQEKFASPWLLWGVCPLLIFWIGRMVLVADRGDMHDDPMVYSITNPTSRLVMLFCGLLVLGAVWL